MRLHYWRHKGVTNFGDMLNPWLWPKLLPDLLERNSTHMLVGIGTLLNSRLPKAERTIVLGAGAGYGPLPEVDDSWSFYAVRGRLTKERLQLRESVALGDPAILAADLFSRAMRDHPKNRNEIVFIPHWTTRSSEWSKVCRRLGVQFVDPLDPVPDVLGVLKGSTLVIAEAMHGAILADAFRVPWIPVHSGFDEYSQFKWRDWGSALGLVVEPQRIVKPWTPPDWDASVTRSLTKALGGSLQLAVATRRFKYILQNAAPALSGDAEMEQRKTDLYQAIDRLRMSRDG